MAVFTVDWEPFWCFKPYGPLWENSDPHVEEPTMYLLDLLRRHDIKAIFYVVGWLRNNCRELFDNIEKEGHVIGNHTYYHNGGNVTLEENFRGPRWFGEKRLYSGGFWLRTMPYWWIKREVEKTGILFVHPHDILLEHVDCGEPIKTLERSLGIKTSRDKLERLCRELSWDEPG